LEITPVSTVREVIKHAVGIDLPKETPMSFAKQEKDKASDSEANDKK